MKKHTFPITVTCILLASALLLTGCMLAVAENNGTPKPYTTEIAEQIVAENSLDNSIIDTESPVPQSEMQKKFGIYLHETENGGIRIFSEEQYDELAAVRDRGERIPLTYDEVLYLISDSINLYFAYDEIILTNIKILSFSSSILIDRVTGFDCLIKFQGDFSAFTDPYQAFADMERDIRMLILYRLYMHDAGLEILDGYTDTEGKFHAINIPEMSFRCICLALSIDGSTAGGDENLQKLRLEVGKAIYGDAYETEFYSSLADTDSPAPQPLNAPLLTFSEGMSFSGGINIIHPDGFAPTQLFPTTEFNTRFPDTEVQLTATTLTDGIRRKLFLNRTNGRFVITDAATPWSSAGITGTFTENNTMLTLYPDNLGNAPYRYVFYRASVTRDKYSYASTLSIPYKDLQFEKGMQFCADYKEQIKNVIMQSQSNATYTISGDSYKFLSHSILRYAEVTYEDGTASEVIVDYPAMPDYIKQNKDTLTDIPLYVAEGYSDTPKVSFETSGSVEKVTLYTPNENGVYIGKTVSFDAFSSLAEGEYVVAVDVMVQSEIYSCPVKYAFTDVFVIYVK